MVYSFPAFANCRFLRSKPHLFISSYAVNWMAPLLTPNNARLVPRYKPAMPSFRQMLEKPSDPSHCNKFHREPSATSSSHTPHSRHRLRYAVGSSGLVVNMRTLTTHIGFVIIAVTAPKHGRKMHHVSRAQLSDGGCANSLAQNRADKLQVRACSSGHRPKRAA